MISRRSKILLVVAALAPAGLFIASSEIRWTEIENQASGLLWKSEHPSALSLWMLLIGLIGVVAAIVSLIADWRASRK
jgi:hypothetical protein